MFMLLMPWLVAVVDFCEVALFVFVFLSGSSPEESKEIVERRRWVLKDE